MAVFFDGLDDDDEELELSSLLSEEDELEPEEEAYLSDF